MEHWVVYGTLGCVWNTGLCMEHWVVYGTLGCVWNGAFNVNELELQLFLESVFYRACYMFRLNMSISHHLAPATNMYGRKTIQGINCTYSSWYVAKPLRRFQYINSVYQF